MTEPHTWITEHLGKTLDVGERDQAGRPTSLVRGRVVEVRHYLDQDGRKWTRVVQEVGEKPNRVKVDVLEERAG